MLSEAHPSSPLRGLLLDQHGVVARRQLIALGLGRVEIERLLRRRLLTPVHTGVYVDHTGPLTWQQRAMGAVLACAPAALARDSALRSYEGPGGRRSEAGPIHLLIDRHRRLVAPEGVVLHRVCDLDERVRSNHAPPRDRYDAAVVDVALTAADRLARIAALSDAVQSRRTTASRLIAEIERRSRIPDRRWLMQVLRDIASGACSALEHGYLVRVERPHGLGLGRRQVRDRVGAGTVYRDVEYTCADGSVLLVELDGRLHHDSADQRRLDLERDLESAVAGARTVRLGWGQVFGHGCRTAAALAQLLGVDLTPCQHCSTGEGISAAS